MTDRRWPILGLDGELTEPEIRRAYAKRLRELGPEGDVASFQALRAEFEAALDAVRGGSRLGASANAATRPLPTRSLVVNSAASTIEPREQEQHRDDPLRRNTVAPFREYTHRASDEIAQLLQNGDLVGACDRFDRAREEDEIDGPAASQIEVDIGRHWLTNSTLDIAALAAIARRYRWDDVLSNFVLAPEIVARLQASTTPVRKPGERFIGKWNWGAFLLTPFWLAAHGMVKRGIVVFVVGAILLIVPLGFIGTLLIAIEHGKKGNALAVKHRTFLDDKQFVAVQNAWRAWAASVYVGALCVLVAVAWIFETYR